MAGSDSFLFYKSWYEIIASEYEPNTANMIFRAIIDYAFTGKQAYPCEKIFLKQAYSQMDSAKAKYLKKCQRNAINGRKGGQANASKKQANASNSERTLENDKRMLDFGKHNDNENDNDNDNDYSLFSKENKNEYNNSSIDEGDSSWFDSLGGGSDV